MFVLDSSVALAWCFGDERTAALNDLENRLLTDTAVVPALWPFEVANVLMLASRKGRITSLDRDRFLAIFRGHPIAVDPDSTEVAMTATLRLADEQRLTVYDAAYLELAVRRSLPLATLDHNLRAASERAGIPLLGT